MSVRTSIIASRNFTKTLNISVDGLESFVFRFLVPLAICAVHLAFVYGATRGNLDILQGDIDPGMIGRNIPELHLWVYQGSVTATALIMLYLNIGQPRKKRACGWALLAAVGGGRLLTDLSQQLLLTLPSDNVQQTYYASLVLGSVLVYALLFIGTLRKWIRIEEAAVALAFSELAYPQLLSGGGVWTAMHVVAVLPLVILFAARERLFATLIGVFLTMNILPLDDLPTSQTAMILLYIAATLAAIQSQLRKRIRSDTRLFANILFFGSLAYGGVLLLIGPAVLANASEAAFLNTAAIIALGFGGFHATRSAKHDQYRSAPDIIALTIWWSIAVFIFTATNLPDAVPIRFVGLWLYVCFSIASLSAYKDGIPRFIKFFNVVFYVLTTVAILSARFSIHDYPTSFLNIENSFWILVWLDNISILIASLLSVYVLTQPNLKTPDAWRGFISPRQAVWIRRVWRALQLTLGRLPVSNSIGAIFGTTSALMQDLRGKHGIPLVSEIHILAITIIMYLMFDSSVYFDSWPLGSIGFPTLKNSSAFLGAADVTARSLQYSTGPVPACLILVILGALFNLRLCSYIGISLLILPLLDYIIFFDRFAPLLAEVNGEAFPMEKFSVGYFLKPGLWLILAALVWTATKYLRHSSNRSDSTRTSTRIAAGQVHG